MTHSVCWLDVTQAGVLDGANGGQEMNYLTCLRRLAEVDGFAPGQQEEHVEQLEHLTAGLVDGRNHCPAVPGQATQRLGHEERRRAAEPHKGGQLISAVTTPATLY
jgi:hypothetical protein